MKVKREELLKSLRLVGSVIDAQSAVTILQYAYVGGGTVQGSDGVVGIIAKAPTLESPFCIAADWLVQLFAKFDKEEIDLTVEQDILHVRSGRHISKAPTADSKRYPNLMLSVLDSSLCECKSGFAKALKTVLDLTPESKQSAMQGVGLFNDAIYATDGSRATRCRWNGMISQPLVLPRESAILLAKHGDPKTIRIGTKNGSLLTTYDGFVIVTRTMSSKIPFQAINDWIVVPHDDLANVRFPDETREVLGRVRLMGGEGGVRAVCKGGVLTLSREKAGSCRSEEELEFSGAPDFDFLCNPERLQAALQVSQHCDLSNVLTGRGNSIRFHAIDGDFELQHLLCLLT